MTSETVHCSTPIEVVDGLRSWKDDAPVREVRTDKDTTLLVFVGGDRAEVVRR